MPGRITVDIILDSIEWALWVWAQVGSNWIRAMIRQTTGPRRLWLWSNPIRINTRNCRRNVMMRASRQYVRTPCAHVTSGHASTVTLPSGIIRQHDGIWAPAWFDMIWRLAGAPSWVLCESRSAHDDFFLYSLRNLKPLKKDSPLYTIKSSSSG